MLHLIVYKRLIGGHSSFVIDYISGIWYLAFLFIRDQSNSFPSDPSQQLW